MLEEWKKCKDIFKKPKLKMYFSFWATPSLFVRIGSNIFKYKDTPDCWQYKLASKFVGVRANPFLPVWRRGNNISLFKGKLSFELPIWLSFYFFKLDMMWKWKYDDVRFEFPPQITIVFFNLALTFWWDVPRINNAAWDDGTMYWESVLNYNYKLSEEDRVLPLKDQMIKISDATGAWISYKDGQKIYHWQLQPHFLKDEEVADELKFHQDKMTIKLIQKEGN